MFLNKNGQWQSCIIDSHDPSEDSTCRATQRSHSYSHGTARLRLQLERVLKIIEEDVVKPEESSRKLRKELEFQTGCKIPHRVLCPINVCLTLHDARPLSVNQWGGWTRSREIERAVKQIAPQHHEPIAELIKRYLDCLQGERAKEMEFQGLPSGWLELLEIMDQAWCHPLENHSYQDASDLQAVIDPLGIYRHNAYAQPLEERFTMYTPPSIQEISLFALPILVSSLRHRLLIRPRALEVLAHEIAHFVTHRGKSITGVDWARFRSADKRVIEGLAQHFTHTTLKRLSSAEGSYQRKPRDRFTEAYQVYLQTVQPLTHLSSRDPYAIQNQWEHSYREEDIVEGFQRFKVGRYQDTLELERLMALLSQIG